MDPRDPALEAQMAAACHGLGLGQPCYAFRDVGSTMDVAHELAEQGSPEGTCVMAERQTRGRGRAGRAWISPSGGLYLSLILRPTREGREIPQLALVTGVAAVEAIRELTGRDATIRWPNDVLIDDKKVAGILVEASTSDIRQQTSDNSETRNSKLETRNGLYAVVGIGINVTTAPRDLPAEATSLDAAGPGPFTLTAVAGTLFRHLAQAYARWQREGFAAIRPQLTRHVGLFGRLVQITTAQGAFEGQAMDVDEAGRLLVRLESGLTRAVEMGDVALLR